MAEKRKPTILIVEDEKLLSDMYEMKFSREGFDVTTAVDGFDGLKKAKSGKPDIILLDIIMPKVDGFAALRDLKSSPETKDIPVILLTNLGQEEDVEKGRKLGADDYFIKASYTPAVIVSKVRQILAKDRKV